jgi:hypothetical protein
MFYTTIAAIAIAGILNWRTGEKLEAAIERLRSETRTSIDSFHAEMVVLHERVTRVEERSK